MGTGHTHINAQTVHRHIYLHVVHYTASMLLQNPYAPPQRDVYTAFNRPVYQRGAAFQGKVEEHRRERKRANTPQQECL